MWLGWIVAPTAASAPRKPLSSAIFDIRHTKFDILHALNLGRAVFGTGFKGPGIPRGLPPFALDPFAAREGKRSELI